jgi:DNA-binding transcriptional ArsR family regulator
MRTNYSALSALLPSTRIGLLTAMLMHPSKWWYLSELARHVETAASSLQRDLAALTEAGILERRQDGNRVYYRPNPECPLLPELQGLIAKTTGLVDVLREALDPLAKHIRVAFVYGSMARGEELASSDVDLLVVGTLGLKDLAPRLQQAAGKLGRPVNPTVYPPDEFAKKVASGHRFLRTVLDGKKLFVIGTSHDLGGPAAPEARPAEPD